MCGSRKKVLVNRSRLGPFFGRGSPEQLIPVPDRVTTCGQIHSYKDIQVSIIVLGWGHTLDHHTLVQVLHIIVNRGDLIKTDLLDPFLSPKPIFFLSPPHPSPKCLVYINLFRTFEKVKYVSMSPDKCLDPTPTRITEYGH